MDIVNWCNSNSGFLTAILSLIGLLLSVIAIIVSISTARLPYKKKMKLSSSFDIVFFKNSITGEVNSEIRGISINAANLGSRNINITYLGLYVKDKSLTDRKQKMIKIKDELTGIGIIEPTEIKTELYNRIDILYALSQMGEKSKVYIYAIDSEGQEYSKYLDNANELGKRLLEN